MKRVICLVSAVGLAGTIGFAQGGGGQGAGQKIGLATSLQRGYAGFKQNFTGNAEKMPDAESKEAMLRIARDYERLAQQAEQRSGLAAKRAR